MRSNTGRVALGNVPDNGDSRDVFKAHRIVSAESIKLISSKKREYI